MTTAELELTSRTPTLSTSTTIKALVHYGPGKHVWVNRPRPTVQDPGDAIVRITTSTIWRDGMGRDYPPDPVI